MAAPSPRRKSRGDVLDKEPAAVLAAPAKGLRCLNCSANGLVGTAANDALVCERCDSRYPVFGCGDDLIPWLFADSRNARLQWKARYNGFLHRNSMELERLRKARAANSGRKMGRGRIKTLLKARESSRKEIVDLLAPLELERIDWPADSTGLLQSKLPRNQGLSSYTSNIFRDWAWDNGENDAQLEAVARVLDADPRDAIGSVLTLGAGAGRLAYDLHRRYTPASSVALDMNPLLLQIASRVIRGETLKLHEFPIAPLNHDSYAVLQECRAPEPLADDNFRFVLGDALDLPFPDASFDTIVTPWLIDIIPQDLRVFLPQLSQKLVNGGVWVNSGSLAFFHHEEAWCYSEEELLELLDECGFELLACERRSLAYLHSPHSAHGRTENILSFSARKVKTVDAPGRQDYLPDWVLDTSLPVPSSPETEIRSSNHLLSAQILAAIDGKRTIGQIGRMLARQYGLGTRETVHAVRQVLTNAWEEIQGDQADREN
jgi:SAM-dependent methyltransferase